MSTPDRSPTGSAPRWRGTLLRILGILRNPKYRAPLVLLLVLLTLAFVIGFFAAHPAYLQQLRHVSPSVVIAVILLNIPTMAALTWAYDAMLRLCGTSMPLKENALLSAYSSIVNFFGPLQSGPGVRAAYVKVRHGVRVRDYMLATFIYYGLFASFSALFLMVGVRPWWQTVLVLGAAATVSIGVIWWVMRKMNKRAATLGHFAFRPAALVSLAIATFLQVCFITTYYFVELRAVNPAISLGQAISYTGAANFSLFVSLTPDAVGFREAFLVFSQHIHHISTANILAANIIDRGSYLLFLVLLFVAVTAVHAKNRLRLKGWRQVQ